MITVRRLPPTLLATLLVIFANDARAADRAAYTKFLNEPSLRQHIINAAARSSVMTHNPCSGAQYQVGAPPRIVKPMAFDPSGAPVAGVLKFPVKEDGCAVTRILNVLVFARQRAQVVVMPLLPGSTRADPILQRDGVQYAFAWAATLVGKNKECKIKYVADTQFIDQEARAWQERWTLIECNRKLIVPLRFIPDATGTRIVAGGPGGGVENVK